MINTAVLDTNILLDDTSTFWLLSSSLSPPPPLNLTVYSTRASFDIPAPFGSPPQPRQPPAPAKPPTRHPNTLEHPPSVVQRLSHVSPLLPGFHRAFVSPRPLCVGDVERSDTGSRELSSAARGRPRPSLPTNPVPCLHLVDRDLLCQFLWVVRAHEAAAENYSCELELRPFLASSSGHAVGMRFIHTPPHCYSFEAAAGARYVRNEAMVAGNAVNEWPLPHTPLLRDNPACGTSAMPCSLGPAMSFIHALQVPPSPPSDIEAGAMLDVDLHALLLSYPLTPPAFELSMRREGRSLPRPCGCWPRTSCAGAFILLNTGGKERRIWNPYALNPWTTHMARLLCVTNYGFSSSYHHHPPSLDTLNASLTPFIPGLQVGPNVEDLDSISELDFQSRSYAPVTGYNVLLEQRKLRTSWGEENFVYHTRYDLQFVPESNSRELRVAIAFRVRVGAD
ncbi:hypothetical protein K438DRAFT_1778174 [Mycena galopus ATCC 62051]|nr:hypothetical protein K438DRAFT_1778174 [Mycena galopus ATCC 62051]